MRYCGGLQSGLQQGARGAASYGLTATPPALRRRAQWLGARKFRLIPFRPAPGGTASPFGRAVRGGRAAAAPMTPGVAAHSAMNASQPIDRILMQRYANYRQFTVHHACYMHC